MVFFILFSLTLFNMPQAKTTINILFTYNLKFVFNDLHSYYFDAILIRIQGIFGLSRKGKIHEGKRNGGID